MRTIQVQSNRPSLIDLYNSHTDESGTKFFLDLMRREKLRNRIVEKIPKVSQLTFSSGQIVMNPNLRPAETSERLLSEALLRLGVWVMFEPVRFNLNKTGLSYYPDIWTNIYIKNKDMGRIVIIENHPFEKPRKQKEEWVERMLKRNEIDPETANRIREYNRFKEMGRVNKMAVMHQDHPELYFKLRSDMDEERFKTEFGISDISLVCDEYRVDKKGFGGLDTPHKIGTRMLELKQEMRQMKNLPDARLQKDAEKWRADVGNIIKQELIKALK